MHTLTQHAPHTNRDRLWATKRNPNTDIQTIHPLSFGICQSNLGSKLCNNSQQHPTNYTKQRSTNRRWLHTNYTNIKAQHNISSPLDLWHSPANCLLFSSGEQACSDRRVEAQQQQLRQSISLALILIIGKMVVSIHQSPLPKSIRVSNSNLTVN